MTRPKETMALGRWHLERGMKEHSSSGSGNRGRREANSRPQNFDWGICGPSTPQACCNGSSLDDSANGMDSQVTLARNLGTAQLNFLLRVSQVRRQLYMYLGMEYAHIKRGT